MLCPLAKILLLLQLVCSPWQNGGCHDALRTMIFIMEKIVKIGIFIHNGRKWRVLASLFVVALLFTFANASAQPATGTKVRAIDPPEPLVSADVDSIGNVAGLSQIEPIDVADEMKTEQIVQTNPAPPATTSRYRRPTPKERKIVDGAVETITVNGVSFNMVGVKGGSFTMGGTEEQAPDVEDDETPAHMVTLGDYSIGETEVTQELWEAIMGRNPSHNQGPQFPVECIRYIDCEAFFFKLNFLTNRNFRLPTEAEWEFAARGGNRATPTKYAGSDDFDSVAWYCNNSGNVTHEVKGKAPNELGLYDMSGNVDEWCNDSWEKYTEMPQTNPKFADSHDKKVRRGGGCLDFPTHLRVSDRRGCSSKMWNFDIGLRLAE